MDRSFAFLVITYFGIPAGCDSTSLAPPQLHHAWDCTDKENPVTATLGDACSRSRFKALASASGRETCPNNDPDVRFSTRYVLDSETKTCYREIVRIAERLIGNDTLDQISPIDCDHVKMKYDACRDVYTPRVATP